MPLIFLLEFPDGDLRPDNANLVITTGIGYSPAATIAEIQGILAPPAFNVDYEQGWILAYSTSQNAQFSGAITRGQLQGLRYSRSHNLDMEGVLHVLRTKLIEMLKQVQAENEYLI